MKPSVPGQTMKKTAWQNNEDVSMDVSVAKQWEFPPYPLSNERPWFWEGCDFWLSHPQKQIKERPQHSTTRTYGREAKKVRRGSQLLPNFFWRDLCRFFHTSLCSGQPCKHWHNVKVVKRWKDAKFWDVEIMAKWLSPRPKTWSAWQQNSFISFPGKPQDGISKQRHGCIQDTNRKFKSAILALCWKWNWKVLNIFRSRTVFRRQRSQVL